MGAKLPPKKGHSSPLFGPCLLWPNGWMDQDSTWYGGRPRTMLHCVRWGPSCLPKKGHNPHFRPMFIVAERSPISATAEHLFFFIQLLQMLPTGLVAELSSTDPPFGAVPVGADVGRNVVSRPGAVHGRVKSIEWLEHVERSSVAVKQLTDERRATSLVRQQYDRWRSNRTNLKILSPYTIHHRQSTS